MKGTKAKRCVGALLLSVFIVGIGTVGFCNVFTQTNYYLLPIGGVRTPIATLAETAKGKGFTVIVRDDEATTAYRGTESTEEPEATLLQTTEFLYVDNERFLLSIAGVDFDYIVRPYETGYALLVAPHRDLPQGETLLAVLNSLSQMGIVGAEVELQGITDFQKMPGKLPAPPEDVAMDSALYALSVAADWFAFATTQNLTRVGLNVEIVAEKLPGGTLSPTFQSHVIDESADFAKLLLPIHLLVDLARAPSVGYVRPPYQPAIP
jgi:hypothetical protein